MPCPVLRTYLDRQGRFSHTAVPEHHQLVERHLSVGHLDGWLVGVQMVEVARAEGRRDGS